MSKPKQSQPPADNNLGPRAVLRLAQDLKRFDEVVRTLELRRRGFGHANSEECSALGMASDEDVLDYFASIDAVYGELDDRSEVSQPIRDHAQDNAHTKPLPGTRPRKIAKESSEKSI